jgi:hypothetical protein
MTERQKMLGGDLYNNLSTLNSWRCEHALATFANASIKLEKRRS